VISFGTGARRTVVTLAGIALVVGACTSGSSGSSAPAASQGASTSPSSAASSDASASTGGGKVALLLPTRAVARAEQADRPFFEAKFKELCPDQAATLIYNNAADDAAAQQQQAEAAITSGATVLVLDPVDGKSAGGIVSYADGKGVKVISYDRLITGPGSKPDFYISFDNVKVGELQGQALLAKLTAMGKTNPKIIWINGSPKDNNATLFKEGAHKVLDGKVQILKEDAAANWLPEEAQQIMEGATAQFGKDGFDGVYVASDGLSGGVFAALKAAGIDPATKPFTAQDAQLNVVQRILLDQQYMSIYKALKAEAEAAATLACDLVKGQAVPASTTNGVTVNNGTADIPSILLVPLAVTADGSVPGTQSVEDTVVKDQFYGPDTVAQLCDAKVDPGLPAACAKYGVK
jgi:D-xylose transport system substrate-binding protein